MDGDGRARLRVFSVVDPGIGSAFADNVRGLQGYGRIAHAVQPFRSLLADAETPRLIFAFN